MYKLNAWYYSSEPQNYNLDKFYYFPRNEFPKTTRKLNSRKFLIPMKKKRMNEAAAVKKTKRIKKNSAFLLLDPNPLEAKIFFFILLLF